MDSERGEVLGELECRSEVKAAFNPSLRHLPCLLSGIKPFPLSGPSLSANIHLNLSFRGAGAWREG